VCFTLDGATKAELKSPRALVCGPRIRADIPHPGYALAGMTAAQCPLGRARRRHHLQSTLRGHTNYGRLTLVGPQASGAEAEIGSNFFRIPFRSGSLGGGVAQEFFQRRFDGSDIVDEARGDVALR
jgi:hypothetical protein